MNSVVLVYQIFTTPRYCSGHTRTCVNMYMYVHVHLHWRKIEQHNTTHYKRAASGWVCASDTLSSNCCSIYQLSY